MTKGKNNLPFDEKSELFTPIGENNLTYFRYCGTTILCDNIGSWSDLSDERYLFRCPECDCFHTTGKLWKATNNSGKLSLDPPDIICASCGLHLQINNGHGKVIFKKRENL